MRTEDRQLTEEQKRDARRRIQGSVGGGEYSPDDSGEGDADVDVDVDDNDDSSGNNNGGGGGSGGIPPASAHVAQFAA